MSLSIQTNVNSITAQENLRINSNFQSRTIQRLTSGYRINNAGDDAAGLSISKRFTSDTAKLNREARSVSDAVGQVSSANGTATIIGNMVDRMKAIAAKSASSSTESDRSSLTKEFDRLKKEINKYAEKLGDVDSQNKNSINISVEGPKVIGDKDSSSKDLNVNISFAASTSALGLDKTSVSTKEDAMKALDNIDNAMKSIENSKAQFGSTLNKLTTNESNIQASRFKEATSKIKDADMAGQLAKITRNQMFQQAGVAVLAQSNLMPQSVLSLLR